MIKKDEDSPSGAHSWRECGCRSNGLQQSSPEEVLLEKGGWKATRNVAKNLVVKSLTCQDQDMQLG